MPPESSQPKGWPFHDPPNAAVFTTTHIFRAGRPILRVFHDEDDGAWQFHYGGAATTKDAMIVALSEVLERDPSIAELSDLPYGWCAERSAPGEPWTRRPMSPEKHAASHPSQKA